MFEVGRGAPSIHSGMGRQASTRDDPAVIRRMHSLSKGRFSPAPQKCRATMSLISQT